MIETCDEGDINYKHCDEEIFLTVQDYLKRVYKITRSEPEIPALPNLPTFMYMLPIGNQVVKAAISDVRK